MGRAGLEPDVTAHQPIRARKRQDTALSVRGQPWAVLRSCSAIGLSGRVGALRPPNGQMQLTTRRGRPGGLPNGSERVEDVPAVLSWVSLCHHPAPDRPLHPARGASHVHLAGSGSPDGHGPTPRTIGHVRCGSDRQVAQAWIRQRPGTPLSLCAPRSVNRMSEPATRSLTVLEIGDVALDEHQVPGAAADHLVGDVDIAVVRIADRAGAHRRERGGPARAGQAPSAPRSTPVGPGRRPGRSARA